MDQFPKWHSSLLITDKLKSPQGKVRISYYTSEVEAMKQYLLPISQKVGLL